MKYFYVDFNDLALLSSLLVILYAFFFFTLQQFDCFFNERLLYHLIHKLGNLRSMGMLGSHPLLNES